MQTLQQGEYYIHGLRGRRCSAHHTRAIMTINVFGGDEMMIDLCFLCRLVYASPNLVSLCEVSERKAKNMHLVRSGMSQVFAFGTGATY